MKTVKQITALMTALLMLFTAAQAERWMPAEENAPRFQQLVVMLEEAVTSGGADTAAIDLLLEEIRREDADDAVVALLPGGENMSCADCFKEFHEIEIDEHNIASNRSLEKAGSRLEGCLKKKWLIRNQFCDANLRALTAE